MNQVLKYGDIVLLNVIDENFQENTKSTDLYDRTGFISSLGFVKSNLTV